MSVLRDVWWRRIASLEDAQAVRIIRNAGREAFGDAREITPEQQADWWRVVSTLPSRDFYGLLFIDGSSPPVGYGMLVRRQGQLWVSLAILPLARRRGLGTRIYEVLATRAAELNEPAYAGIRRDNIPSLRAVEKAGYKQVSEVVPDVARLDDWCVFVSS